MINGHPAKYFGKPYVFDGTEDWSSPHGWTHNYRQHRDNLGFNLEYAKHDHHITLNNERAGKRIFVYGVAFRSSSAPEDSALQVVSYYTFGDTPCRIMFNEKIEAVYTSEIVAINS